MERFFNKLTLGLGAPLLLAAALGGAIAMAQEGDDATPTPAPTEEAAPDDGTPTTPTTPKTPKSRGGDGCPEDGGGSGGSEDSTESSTDDSGV